MKQIRRCNTNMFYLPLHSPVLVVKNPSAHFAHACPFAPVVHPGLHAHCPFDPQTPFTQLHWVTESWGPLVCWRQRPVPASPSSHLSQPVFAPEHDVQLGPKNPCAHCSQEFPEKPCGQTQTPLCEHTPELEQGGLQDDDWRSSNAKDEDEGSWVMSGTESQIMVRWLFGPRETAAHTPDDKERERAVSGIEVFVVGTEGRLENAAWPE